MANKCYGVYNTDSSMHILWKNLTSDRGDIHAVQYLYSWLLTAVHVTAVTWIRVLASDLPDLHP